MIRGLYEWFSGPSDDANATRVERPGRARVDPVAPAVRLLERFADGGEIASGGMGSIRRVLDQNLLRQVAMKVISPPLAGDPLLVERFIEEAQITGQLDHPNIVPVHELGADEQGTLYFTMKLVEGETLAKLIERRAGEVRSVTWLVEYLEIFVKICDAVAFAHSRGVVHRDLKPANVMVGTFGQVYVMDWGLARLMAGTSDVAVSRPPGPGALDEDGVVLGSVAYMSPEQARGENQRIDERSDVYSLGAVLYHVLAGQPPYVAASYDERLALAREGAVRPVEEMPLARDLPGALCAIATRALAPGADQRYPSVPALRQDVMHILRRGFELPTRTFPAGAIIVAEGETGDAAYVIHRGTCRAFRTALGVEVELRRMGPGEVFGEAAILAGTPRTASVEAVDEVTVLVVTADTLRDGVGLNSLLGPFVRALAERFREVDERLAAVGKGT